MYKLFRVHQKKTLILSNKKRILCKTAVKLHNNQKKHHKILFKQLRINDFRNKIGGFCLKIKFQKCIMGSK